MMKLTPDKRRQPTDIDSIQNIHANSSGLFWFPHTVLQRIHCMRQERNEVFAPLR